MKVDYENGSGKIDAGNEPKALSPLVPKTSFFKRHRLVVCFVFAVVLICTALLAKPTYRFANAWRARRLAASALDHAGKHDMDKALLQARAAYQLKSDEAVVRAIAKILTLRHDPNAFLFWQSLVKSPAATLDDRRSYVETALDQRLTAPAAEEVGTLLTMEPGSALNYLLASKLNAITGDSAGALACARHACELDGSNQDASLFLASLEIASLDSRLAGLQLLWSLADGSNQASLAAVELLARQKGLSNEEQERLIARLKNHPLATESDRLLMLEIEIRRYPEKRDALLETAMTNYRATGGDNLRQFAVWLNARGESTRVADAIPAEQALSRKDLFLVYLDALAGQKKWADIGALLKKSGLPLEETYVEMYKSRCCAELGDNDGADQHWRFAQIAAAKMADTGNPEQAFYLANYAEKLGQSEKAVGVYRTLVKSPLTSRPAYEALLRIAVAKGTQPTRDLLREMRTRWLADVAIQNDYAYLQLLLGEEIDASREKAAELVGKFPNSLPHLTTLALAYLRSGNPSAALKVYGNLPIAWDKAPAPSVAIYAAVLNANERTDEARKLAVAIPPNALRPEERALIGIGFR